MLPNNLQQLIYKHIAVEIMTLHAPPGGGGGVTKPFPSIRRTGSAHCQFRRNRRHKQKMSSSKASNTKDAPPIADLGGGTPRRGIVRPGARRRGACRAPPRAQGANPRGGCQRRWRMAPAAGARSSRSCSREGRKRPAVGAGHAE